jgi:hypothetical protein
MTAMNGTHKREIIERPRARRNAAKVLALTLQNRLRALYDAQTENDEDKIVMATANLAQVMYENVEFAIWALKTVAGMSPPPPESLKPISQSHVRASAAGQRSQAGNRARFALHMPAVGARNSVPRAAHDVLPEIRPLKWTFSKSPQMPAFP